MRALLHELPRGFGQSLAIEVFATCRSLISTQNAPHMTNIYVTQETGRKPSRKLHLVQSTCIYLSDSHLACLKPKPRHHSESCGILESMRYSHWATNPFFILLLLHQTSSTSTGFPCEQLPSKMYIYLPLTGDMLKPSCEDDQAMIRVNDQKSYQVKSIDTTNMTIRLIDPGLKLDNCSSLPLYRTTTREAQGFGLRPSEMTKQLVLQKCPYPLPNPPYVATSPCLNSSREINHTLYAVLLPALESTSNFLRENCCVVASTIAESGECLNCSFADIHQRMNAGFDVWYDLESYLEDLCWSRYQSSRCFLQAAWWRIIDALPTVRRVAESLFIARSSVGALIMLVVIAYKLLRRHLSTDESIEEFLQQYKKSIPKTYSYLHIIKITRNFKEKLGKGGFGSVYKGKLSSGQLVAVKMLSDSKGKGQDFINEVATIGRIHHSNIVQLLGFCSAGTRRALVYQYMPNGSLDKHIFSTEEGHSLSWDQVYQIAIGIARGIQYLHQGCDMKILHFDIKPHNILLDENLAPKISDFGLSKYCSTDQSVVSVTAMRGTIGYMAPELFYQSSAGVSTKSDVYSFGMLLMEMAGKRKNMNPTAKTSQVYFPSWIYDKLHEEDLEVEAMLDASEGEKEMVKKLLIVGLWCIQMKPIDRPSMTGVVEMLEGSVELLQMPPKPFSSSLGRDDDEYNIVIDTSSLVADEPISSHSF